MLGCGALIFLTACGSSSSSGSSTGDGSGPDVGQDFVTLPQLIARAGAFEEEFGTINVDSELLPPQFTPAGAIPSEGSTTYTGVALMGRGPNQANPENELIVAMGSTTMTANFNSGAISGSADNFFLLDNPNLSANSLSNVTGERVDGSMTYNLARQGNNNEYAGQFVGSFTPAGEATININVPGRGAFLGPNLGGFITEGFDDQNNFAGIIVTAD